MKRILYIEANRDGTIGGSYYSLLYLLQGLDKSRYEPHVLFCQDNVLIPEYRKVVAQVYVNDFDPSISDLSHNWLESIKKPFRLFTEVLFKQPRLRRIIREIQPDLVHLNNGYSSMHEWMLACSLAGIPIVAHDRGTRYPATPRTKLFVRFLDATISVSDSYRGYLVKQDLKVKRIRRVYNGLDVDKMAKALDPQAAQSLRTEIGIPAGVPVIGIVGNIDTWKGQLIVLQAVQQLRRDYPDVIGLIIGPVSKGAEEYKAQLDRYVTDNGLQRNVVFTGFRRDVANVLSLLDVMVHASIEPEPFGRVILEGMALSKPIVATDSGGTVEQIVHGETGLLVPMGDADAMAAGIRQYLANPEQARAMGVRGRQRLVELFSIQRMVRETQQIYDEIFAAGEPAHGVRA